MLHVDFCAQHCVGALNGVFLPWNGGWGVERVHCQSRTHEAWGAVGSLGVGGVIYGTPSLCLKPFANVCIQLSKRDRK